MLVSYVMESLDPLEEAAAVLGGLKQALTEADRCLELARRERDRVNMALNASSGNSTEAERQVLDRARRGRERLQALDPAVPPPMEKIPVVEPARPLPSPQESPSPATWLPMILFSR